MGTSVLPPEFTISEKLTLDFLNKDTRLERFLSKHPRRSSRGVGTLDREKVVKKLREYNRRMDAPERALVNIDALLRPETYAVMTGQQPGLLCGPLFTIYKAISAIVVCEKHSRTSNGTVTLVPVFWNASEDHHLSEVDHITIFKQNNPIDIDFDIDPQGLAFSHIILNKREVRKSIAAIDSITPDSEFKKPLLKEIEESLRGSSTLGEFFSRLMLRLLGNKGLVVVEPHYLRELTAPVFEELIKKPTECTRILNETASELRELGYSAKIHKKADLCNFFLLDDQGKRLQVTYSGEFHVDNRSLTEKELLHLLEADPARFSASAAIRPITQDFVFPTYSYVAGPNEVAYYAQLKGIYTFFSMDMPAILPRLGATIVEKKVSKILTKYKTEISEFRTPEKLLRKLARERVEDVFDSFRSETKAGISRLTPKVQSIDPALAEPCSLTESRILKTIDRLERTVTTRLKKTDTVARNQIQKVANNLFPYGELQERKINVFEYLIKFGKEFLDKINDSFLESELGEHKVIAC